MSLTINVTRTNPDQKPLGDLVFPVQENGVILKVPALSKNWITARTHTKYKLLPVVNEKVEDQSAAVDEWLEIAQNFNEEMVWMLQLDHHIFWSYLVYDDGCIASIISFLQDATPFYTPVPTLTTNDRIINLYSEILYNVMRIICRMVTNRESATDWMTKEHLADLIYSKYLISIPMLFDIIVAYGRPNSTLLHRIFKTVFTIEPKYKDDLKQSFKFIKNAFEIVQQKINENDDKTSFDELTTYTLDLAASIAILLEVYPDICEMCLDVKLETSITNFYDATLPALFKQIYIVNPMSASLKHLSRTRIELLGTFRCLSNMYLEKILSNPAESILPAESFLAMLQEALADYVFVVDYQRMYPVQNDIDILKQACSELDLFKVDFIYQAYTSENKNFHELFMANGGSSSSGGDQDADDDIEGAAAAIPTNAEDQQIQCVLDVLPHLSKDFVQKLLTRYESTELAIAAVLEGNLPPDLADTAAAIVVEQQLKSESNDKPGTSSASILSEFSHRGRPAVLVKSGKGFPGAPKTMKALLDDKSHVHSLRTRYEEYGLVPEGDYDDEYDDSYDAIAETERKIKNVVACDIDESDGEEDDDDVDEQQQRDRTKDFCENPEAIRERWAQNRNNRQQAKRPAATAKPTDVVGKPKGQGQDNDTQFNRHKKDVHKSSRANHNRRQGATWKRNRGMIPS